MLPSTLTFAAMACLIHQSQAATVKRYAEFDDADDMFGFSSLLGYEGSGGYDYDGMKDISLYFFITYEKPFNDDWLLPGSDSFSREADIVESTMKQQIARSLGVTKEDVFVQVIGFLPGSTKAEIEVRIPEYHKLTEKDMSDGVREIAEFATVDGWPISEIEEIRAEFTEEGQKKETIIMELVYDVNIADKAAELADDTSEAFVEEATNLTQQLSLILVDKLASNGIIVLPDQISVEVLTIESEGDHTKAQVSVQGNDVDIEQLSYALQLLVLHDDVKLNDGTIISAEELSRDISYESDEFPVMDEKVMEDHDDFLNGYGTMEEDEEDESDDLFPKMEVMADKEEERLNGIINDEPLPSESVPREDGVVVPALEPIPPDVESALPVLKSGPSDEEPAPPDEESAVPVVESVPSDEESASPVVESAPPGEESAPPVVESIPPDEDGGESVPPDDRCSELQAPDRAVMDCFNGNVIGSQCQFICDSETRLVGSDTTQCGPNGWTYDPPHCVRILCQPSQFRFPNGEYHCTNTHAYQSVCTFMCKNDEFELTGEKNLMCQGDETWTSDPPTCEPIPVNCDDHYGPWSECADGKRSKAAVTVTMADIETVCEEVEEECIDCLLVWSEWSLCDRDDIRYRSQHVGVEKVGAGKDCPEPEYVQQQCKDCVVDWEDWGPCVSGGRTRWQYIKEQPVGDDDCPALIAEDQDCSDCVLGWSEWGECVDSVAIRAYEVLQEATNGGKSCSEYELPGEVMIECQNCEVAWPQWTECEGGERSRTEFVLAEQVGPGLECPELRDETENCVHCELEWGDWEACIDGMRRQIQHIGVEAVGAGRQCGAPQLNLKVCANCEVGWGEWEECVNGSRKRQQIVTQQPVEVDEPCPALQEDSEPCSDCEFVWSDWSECIRGEKTRFLLVESEAVGAGKPCPEEQLLIEDCCYMEWGPWSECIDGQRTRVEEVIVEPDDEFCREPRAEKKNCADCMLEWGDWSECENNVAKRTQIVVQQAVGGGKDCSEVDVQTEYCADCEISWGEWGRCQGDGMRFRTEVILKEAVGRGQPCSEILAREEEECVDCQWFWSPWTNCANGRKSRTLEILQPPVGAGESCPEEESEEADCQNCVVEWGEWSECVDEQSIRQQYVSIPASDGGEECPRLETDTQRCVDCAVDWGVWSDCSNDERTRSQYVVTPPEGLGDACPELRTESEDCIDCVVEWGPWSVCYNSLRQREETVVVNPVGVGRECPQLASEEEECEGTGNTSVICRFAHKVLGYGRPPLMRDLLLIGDESGSIGWLNFEKIKVNFKSVAKNIRGGIGSQETQIAMTSFALFSRTVFDFDDHRSADDVVAAIDRSYFKGGYRSRIGESLSDANVWLFQQTGGMRSFPNIADNIEHEILIATDGCRTSDMHALQKGLKTVKKRGIKLYVLAIETPDARCRKTVESMVGKEDLFLVGGWDELDAMTKAINDQVCFFDEATEVEEEDEEESVDDAGEEVKSPEEEQSGAGEESNEVGEESVEFIPVPIEEVSRGDSAGL